MQPAHKVAKWAGHRNSTTSLAKQWQPPQHPLHRHVMSGRIANRAIAMMYEVVLSKSTLSPKAPEMMASSLSALAWSTSPFSTTGIFTYNSSLLTQSGSVDLTWDESKDGSSTGHVDAVAAAAIANSRARTLESMVAAACDQLQLCVRTLFVTFSTVACFLIFN